LDGGAVFDAREGEGGAAAFAFAGIGDGLTGGVVVVTELLVAEAGGAATVAVGEDVAAEEACFGVVFAGGHLWNTPYPG
jgi:hypothetical protein